MTRTPTVMELRVAQAMMRRYPIGFEVIPHTAEQAMGFYILLAADALRAMRAPTPEMVEAAWPHTTNSTDELCRANITAEWQTMIDAASPQEDK